MRGGGSRSDEKPILKGSVSAVIVYRGLDWKSARYHSDSQVCSERSRAAIEDVRESRSAVAQSSWDR